jgi:hypothetical protein
MPLKRLGRQCVTCLTSLRGTGILGAQSCIVCDGGPFQHIFETVSNWPDAVLVTANKFFIRIHVISLLSFPRSSCSHISLTKLLRPYIHIGSFCSPVSVEHVAYV